MATKNTKSEAEKEMAILQENIRKLNETNEQGKKIVAETEKTSVRK